MDKKPDNVVWDKEKGFYQSLTPYGTNVSAPTIDVPDVGGFKRTGVDRAKKNLSAKLNELKKRPDWPEWQKARYKMLDSYLDQEMFSDSMENPQKCQCTPHAMAVHS